jgi:hypothetical protein
MLHATHEFISDRPGRNEMICGLDGLVDTKQMGPSAGLFG